MAVDRELIRAFQQEKPIYHALITAMQRGKFLCTWITRLSDERLVALYFKLDRNLRERFSTEREVLVFIADYPSFQAKTISTAMSVIARDRPRLNEDFAIIVTPDPHTEKAVAETAQQLPTTFIGITYDNIFYFFDRPALSIVEDLQHRLGARDLYWMSTAITRERDFYGRQAVLAELPAVLRDAQTHVGVFGLRKIGKTSLLYQVLETVRRKFSCIVTHLDMQRITSISPTVEYFLWSIGQGVYDAMPKEWRAHPFELFGRKLSGAGGAGGIAVKEAFFEDMRAVLAKSDKTIVIAIDEIELMSPTTLGCAWGSAYLDAWRLLRGIDQENPGRIAFFVTGTNPAPFEAREVSGADNPTYNYFMVKYLPFFSEQDSVDLLNSIGKRMGLQWHGGAARRAHSIVGGHPFLLRALGSLIHRHHSPRKQAVVTATDADVNGCIRQLEREVASSLSQMLEVLQEYYKNEYVILETLALGKVSEFRELEDAFPQDVTHLHGYGLVAETQGVPRISVELLQAWLQKRSQAKRRQSQERETTQSGVEVGDVLDDYELVEQIGHRGGLAKVFRARKAGLASDSVATEEYALKLILSGSLASLQRELDVLQSLHHPNIVEFRDSGKTPSGHVYLVMDLVRGKSLRDRCTRAKRLGSGDSRRITMDLLLALEYIHPRAEVVESLRQKPELTSDEYKALEAARHGYVHRDVKPENIMLTEELDPVLIDFNISCRAGQSVLTRSFTMGYLPGDFNGTRWTPDVDLFGLGVSMLEATLGMNLADCSLADLRHQAKAELDEQLGRVLLRLTAPSAEDRYPSASDAHRDLARGG